MSEPEHSRRKFVSGVALAGLAAGLWPFPCRSAMALEAGQPSRTAQGAAQLAGELKSAGFSATHALGSAEMNQRYFGNRADGFRLYGSGRMMAARV